MKPDSPELARRIDVMVAYQNGEDTQYKNHGTKSWITATTGGLSFNWEHCDFRTKPELRSGFIFEEALHKHPNEHRWKKGQGTCFPVVEVELSQ